MPWTDDSDPGPWSPPSEDGRQVEAPHARRRKSDGDRTASAGPWGDPAQPPPRRPPSTLGQPKADRPRLRLGARLPERGRRAARALSATIARGSRLRPDRRLLLGLAAAAVAAWALSGVYTVGEGETAVTTRFGAVVGVAGAGIAYHLPAPIERTALVATHVVQRVDMGGEDAPPMLTADDLLVQPVFNVRWRPDEPVRYLAAGDATAILRDEAVQALRRVVGRTPFAALQQTPLLKPLEARAALDLQAALDRRRAGVAVVALELTAVAPAAATADAFRQVETARQEVQGELEQARAYGDRAVQAARSEAERTVRAAGAYSEQATREAPGEAARFALIDAQYRRYPEVTRQRLYTEMMEHVLRASNKVVVQTGKGVAVTLPPELFKPHPTPDAAALPPAAGPAAPGGGEHARP